METDQIKRLRELARRAPGLRALVLIGSHARGDEHMHSDVDLAYLAGGSFDAARFLGEATMALGRDDVDLADLDRAGAVLRFDAAAEGVLLHGDMEAFERFRRDAVRFWCDAGHIIREAHESTLTALG